MEVELWGASPDNALPSLSGDDTKQADLLDSDLQAHDKGTVNVHVIFVFYMSFFPTNFLHHF